MWDCRPIRRSEALRGCACEAPKNRQNQHTAYDGKLLERLCYTLPQTGALTGLRYAPTPLANGAWVYTLKAAKQAVPSGPLAPLAFGRG